MWNLGRSTRNELFRIRLDPVLTAISPTALCATKIYLEHTRTSTELPASGYPDRIAIMPKSKRAKVVHLSKVEKKGKELNVKLFADIRASLDKYQYCYVFAVDNMRNTYLKDVRSHFAEAGGRLFFGKTKVMAKAIGHNPEEEHLPNLHKLTPFLSGTVGLLCTNQMPVDVLQYFKEYVQTDFARAGIQATRDFVVPSGVVYSRGGEIPQHDDEPLVHSIEPNLRSRGMPTRLDKGKVILDGDHEICKEGQELNSHQTALLKMFGVAMAEFRVLVQAYYDSNSESVSVVREDGMEE